MSSNSTSVLSRIPAAILTGGQARRFDGRDKTGLIARSGAGPGTRTILTHQLEQLSSIASEILIVTSAARAAEFTDTRIASALRTDAKAGPRIPIRVVLDDHPGSGPLGAILTALAATRAAAAIVVAGDMPHVSSALLAALARLHDPEGADATVPESARGLEPLCAVYGRSARTELARALESGDLSLQRALERLRVRVMRADDVRRYGDAATLFRNINAPEDLF